MHLSSFFPGPATALNLNLPSLTRLFFQQPASILVQVEAPQQAAHCSRQQAVAVEQYRLQAGFVVLHGGGGEQGLGVQGGLQQGDGLPLLLLGLAVGG